MFEGMNRVKIPKLRAHGFSLISHGFNSNQHDNGATLSVAVIECGINSFFHGAVLQSSTARTHTHTHNMCEVSAYPPVYPRRKLIVKTVSKNLQLSVSKLKREYPGEG